MFTFFVVCDAMAEIANWVCGFINEKKLDKAENQAIFKPFL